jgi:hypothetical protein
MVLRGALQRKDMRPSRRATAGADIFRQVGAMEYRAYVNSTSPNATS